MQISPDSFVDTYEQRLKSIGRTKEIYKRIDEGNIPAGDDEIRLFVIARNESLRLPYFLSYYFNLGVDRIFLIDNGSTDMTCDIALRATNVHIFQITESFKDFWNWIEYFLETYGKDRWCFVVDVDELFTFPHSEKIPLKVLLHYLDQYQYTAVKSCLLDMYSKKKINNTKYMPGQDPLKACPYFDTDFKRREQTFFDPKHMTWYKYEIIFGGMRQRIFGEIGTYKWSYCLSKNSLFKYSDDIYLAGGMHTINGARFADIHGVTFHTKFLYDFIEETEIESEREVHFCDGLEYKLYNYRIEENPDLSLHYKGSVKYESTQQLIDFGIIRTSKLFDLVYDSLV